MKPSSYASGRGVLWAAAVALLVLAAAAPAGAAEGPAAFYPDVENLDQPGHSSRYAFLNAPVVVRASPTAGARRIARLQTKTEDGTDELVSIIARSKDARGRWWLRVRLPVRPNGTTGWVPRSSLGEIRRVETWLIVDLKRTRMVLVKSRKVVFRARVGVGQSRWPTPTGRFYVRNRLSGASLGPLYGPLAFGTSARSSVLTDWPGGGVIGIHGTSEPGLLPGRVSHGCIRLRNADVLRLGRLMPVGTPILIA